MFVYDLIFVLFVETNTKYAAVLLMLCVGDSLIISTDTTTTTTPYPHIVCTGDLFDSTAEFKIFVDRQEVVSTNNIVNAITVSFLQHWIFNIVYPKKFFGILSFLDVFVFRKKSVRATQKAVSFVNAL
jgi:hypothetical protein